MRHVVIVAGGKGSRMGADIPKQFLSLQGKPILLHTLDLWAPLVDGQLVLVLPKQHIRQWQAVLKEFPDTPEHLLAEGGAFRHESSRKGIEALSAASDQDLVAIHDGVRPLTDPKGILEAYDKAEDHGSVVLAVRPKSSMREDEGSFSKTIDRGRFWMVQTPQIFQLGLYRRAMEKLSLENYLDDASFLEAAGHKVLISPGTYDNIKITTPVDIALAEVILQDRNLA